MVQYNVQFMLHMYMLEYLYSVLYILYEWGGIRNKLDFLNKTKMVIDKAEFIF
jgi:hypothetical protein